MISVPSSTILSRMRARFERLYGGDADRYVERLAMMVGRYGALPGPAASPWSERDSLLITYGDMVPTDGEKPLTTLKRVLDQRAQEAISTVHVLPFCLSSSDDGFSVVHFRKVNPDVGDWSAVQSLGERFRLMFDLVLNHTSAASGWARDYELGIAPGCNYFIEADPRADWSAVTRPRSTPLFKRVSGRRGDRHLWTTFSADQWDLNYANPDVLFEMLDLLAFYASMGARIIRLDAIAYIWKKQGTSCVHLPETHEVVRLFHDFLQLTAPHVLLLTETNVPQPENLSYFGQGDEANLVYQFPLPPLVLHALATGTARHLSEWAAHTPAPPPGCTYLNFTASHDGIGLRPALGLIPDADISKLVDHAVARGGAVSTAAGRDGRDSPYELNITYFDALGAPAGQTDDLHAARFLCSQAIPLILRGIPAVYFNSLVAGRNDAEGVKQTGRARSINRKKWTEKELSDHLAPGSVPKRVLDELSGLLKLRAKHPAFHPDGAQRIFSADDRVFAVERVSPDGAETVVALSNCSPDAVQVDVNACRAAPASGFWRELIADVPLSKGSGVITLKPYGSAWLWEKR